MFGPRYLKYAWGGKWGFVGNFIAAAAAILPPLRGHFFSFVIYVTRKPKLHFYFGNLHKANRTHRAPMRYWGVQVLPIDVERGP